MRPFTASDPIPGVAPCSQAYVFRALAAHEDIGRNAMAKALDGQVSREKAHQDLHAMQILRAMGLLRIEETDDMDDTHPSALENPREQGQALTPQLTADVAHLAAQVAQLRQDRARDTAVIMSHERSLDALESRNKILEAQLAAHREDAEHWRAFLQIIRTDAPTWYQLEALLQMKGPGKRSALTHWLRALAQKPQLDPWC